MSNPKFNDGAPPPAWDIAYTRLFRSVLPHVDKCTRALEVKFAEAGLWCDKKTRTTPRGVTTYLSVVGQRGLLFIVDFTLVDGMAVCHEPGAALDVRLLDACGDVQANLSPLRSDGSLSLHTSSAGIIKAVGQGLSVISIQLTAQSHFEAAQI